MSETKGFIAPDFAILRRFSCLCFASNRISMVACFCSTMEQDSSLRTRLRMNSSEFSEAHAIRRRRFEDDVVGNSPDLSLLQSLNADVESSLTVVSMYA